MIDNEALLVVALMLAVTEISIDTKDDHNQTAAGQHKNITRPELWCVWEPKVTIYAQTWNAHKYKYYMRAQIMHADKNGTHMTHTRKQPACALPAQQWLCLTTHSTYMRRSLFIYGVVEVEDEEKEVEEAVQESAAGPKLVQRVPRLRCPWSNRRTHTRHVTRSPSKPCDTASVSVLSHLTCASRVLSIFIFTYSHSTHPHDALASYAMQANTTTRNVTMMRCWW